VNSSQGGETRNCLSFRSADALSDQEFNSDLHGVIHGSLKRSGSQRQDFSQWVVHLLIRFGSFG
jgi:hypothetical protein